MVKRIFLGALTLQSNKLMQLARFLVNKSYESQQYAIPAAKICIDIIQKEKNSIFFESLMNICQKTYQDSDKVLNQFFISYRKF